MGIAVFAPMYMWGRVQVLTVGAILIGAAPAAADVVQVGASADTTLFQEDGTLSNGAGDHMFCGLTNDSYERRALLGFDIAGAVPSGATIDAVTLTLSMSRTRTENLNVALHRVTAGWGEAGSHAAGEEGAGAPAQAGDASWTHRLYATAVWTAAGGDAIAGASATTAVGAVGSYTWSSATMVTDVQGWLDTPASNHGWLLRCADASRKDTKRFDTHDNGTASVRPMLTITFTPVGQTGACCAADGSCTVVSHPPGSSCAGTYSGAGTVCAPNSCPQPTGACCAADAAATCTEVTEVACTGAGGSFQGAAETCAPNPCPVVLTPFVDPLPRPAVAQPVTGTAGGAASYQLSMVEISQKLHRDLSPTRVWGFDDGTGGSFPGPTLETATGVPITVTWANELRDGGGNLRTDHFLAVDTCPHGAVDASPRTVIHLHGGHVPAAVDGYPEATFLPGQQTVYTYPNAQPAATLWYHDHALGITRLNVYMGLAGFYLVRDSGEAALGLPAGTYEIPVVIQDRRFRPDGSLVYPASWQEHYFGDVVVVNGKVWPYLDVARGKYRLHVLNGSGSRTYRLHLSEGATFYQIGTDGGLLAAPVALTELTLGPGERADLVLDFAGYAPGTEVVLTNDAPAPFPGSPGVGVIADVMKFVVTDQTGHTAALPSSLRTVAALDATGAIARDFLLEKVADTCTGARWTINGLGWGDITEQPNLGTTEVWRFVNNSGVMHPMHMHLVFFQVLDRQPFTMMGGVPTATGPAVPPPPHEAGWKDTVRVAPGEMVRVIARFDDYLGKFPYHCHILEHEDHEMMRQFQTVTTCGDGARGQPDEECDDGNTIDGDGCSASCTIEPEVDGGVFDGGMADAGAPDASITDAGATTPDATVDRDAGIGNDDGGGCCDAGSRPGGSVLWAIAILALAVRRRRRGPIQALH